MRRLIVTVLLVATLSSFPVTAFAADEPTWLDGISDNFQPTYSDSTFYISSAEELAWISYKINSGSTFIGKTIKLINDIDLLGKLWIPMGGHDMNFLTQTNYTFSGIFDGNGKAISNMSVGSVNNYYQYDYCGLFGINSGRIKDLGLINISIYNSGEQAGGITGNNTGYITNCYVSGGKVHDSGGRAGTLVGFNNSIPIGHIENCFSTADISIGSSQSGGLVGFQRGYVTNCYYAGNCSLGGGAVIGYNQDGTTTSCYWSKETGKSIVGTGYGTDGTKELTLDFMKSEDFVELLFCGNLDWKDWKEDLDNINNGFPVLNIYLNPVKFWIADATEAYENNGVFEIYNASQLSWIAQEVNAGNSFSGKTIKLVSNIDLSGKQWTPIGITEDNCFKGLFDGNGKLVINLTIGTTNVGVTYNFVGLIGFIKDSLIINTGLINAAVFSIDGYTGSLAGCTSDTTIQKCYATGIVHCNNWYAGGLIGGGTYSGFIQNCYTNVKVSGNNFVGGILGYGHKDPIENCYVAGDIEGKSSYYVGMIAGGANTVSDSYWNIEATVRIDGFIISEDKQCGVGSYSSSNDTSTGHSITELQNELIYKNWDWENSWDISSDLNDGLPLLRWQYGNFSLSYSNGKVGLCSAINYENSHFVFASYDISGKMIDIIAVNQLHQGIQWFNFAKAFVYKMFWIDLSSLHPKIEATRDELLI